MFDYTKDESNSVVLVDVPVRKIFPCKNPGYKVVSIDYDKSENGYGNVVLNANNIRDKGNGYCDAYVGEKGMWREVSILQNGEYKREKMPLENMLELFNNMKQKEANQINKAFESRAKQQNNNYYYKNNSYQSNTNSNTARHNVFLNNVSTNRIRPAKNGGDFSSVFLAYKDSDDGYLRVAVSNKFIFNKGNNPNTRNINLGYNDRLLNCSVLKDGKFEKVQMKAEDIAALDVENTKKFEAKRNKESESSVDTPQVSQTNVSKSNNKVVEDELPFESGFNFEANEQLKKSFDADELPFESGFGSTVETVETKQEIVESIPKTMNGVKVVTEEELFANESTKSDVSKKELVDAKDELDVVLNGQTLENEVKEPIKKEVEVNNMNDFDILSDLESMYGRDDYVEEDDYGFGY